MEEEVSNNGGPWRARMNSCAPRQKEKKKKKKNGQHPNYSTYRDKNVPYYHLKVEITIIQT